MSVRPHPRSLLGLVLCLLPLIAWPSIAAAAPTRLLTATVARVADGDTLIAYSASTRLRIRLLGIDAPEVAHDRTPAQPYGKEARAYLEQLVGGKAVRVESYGRDHYRRVLAVLWVDRKNVNAEMVRAGMAELYREARCRVYCRELREAEREARQARVGILE